jgi:unsaturated rhamnogalacturonyl hydrolase
VSHFSLSRNYRQTRLHTAGLLLFCLLTGSLGLAQTKSGNERSPYMGDNPDNPGPLATDLSPALQHQAVRAAMRKVADWELARTEGHLEQDWTFAALYQGWIAASDTLNDPKYINAVEKVSAEDFHWQLGPRTAHADDEAIAQSYLDIYRKKHDPTMIEQTQKSFDTVMATPDNPDKPLWWWCDALFMAPRAWLLLSKETKNPAYLNYMDRQWWITSDLLYDKTDHLYSRDATYLNQHEANGRKIYWARGNGWVAAGIVRVLQDLPKDFPNRPKYVEQYKEMAEEIASLQGSDGLWRPGMLDAASYPLPEDSGSAFFVYSLAWGINHGLLNRHKYLPVVEKGWQGLISHIYQDGRLGCIQPVGAAPGKYKEGSSYNFGIGAFLLAGSEVDRLSK